MTVMTSGRALATAAAVPALLLAAQAQAHAHLVASTPAANAAVAAPKALHLQFNEKLEPKFSAADLTTAVGVPVPVTSKAAGVAIEATPKAPLAPGAYLVKWHVLSADGHKSEGVFNFSVR